MSVKSVSFDEKLSIRHFEKDEGEVTINSVDYRISMGEKNEALIDSSQEVFDKIITEAKKNIDGDFQKIFSTAIESADEDEIGQKRKLLEVEKERQYSSYGQDVLNFTKDLECRDDEVTKDSKLLEDLKEEFQDYLDERIKKLGRRIASLGVKLERLEIKKIFDEIASEIQINKMIKGLEEEKVSLEGGRLKRFFLGLPESDARNINRIDKSIIHLNEKLQGLRIQREEEAKRGAEKGKLEDRYTFSINSNDSKKLIEAIAYFEDMLEEQNTIDQDFKGQIKGYIKNLEIKFKELQKAVNEALISKE